MIEGLKKGRGWSLKRKEGRKEENKLWKKTREKKEKKTRKKRKREIEESLEGFPEDQRQPNQQPKELKVEACPGQP